MNINRRTILSMLLGAPVAVMRLMLLCLLLTGCAARREYRARLDAVNAASAQLAVAARSSAGLLERLHRAMASEDLASAAADVEAAKRWLDKAELGADEDLLYRCGIMRVLLGVEDEKIQLLQAQIGSEIPTWAVLDELKGRVEILRERAWELSRP